MSAFPTFVTGMIYQQQHPQQYYDVEDTTIMPWEVENYIPLTKSGKQKTPNMIRNQFQKYLDENKKVRTQTSILEEIGVNSNSFRKFMNPKTYKNPWSATENGTYWAAAKFLEKEAYCEKVEKENAKTKKKRKANTVDTDDLTVARKSSKTDKLDAELFMASIAANIDFYTPFAVFDSCPEMVKKIKTFLEQNDAVTKTSFCRYALGGINGNSLAQFLAAKKDTQRGNVAYRSAYAFFEHLRIMKGEAKTNARLQNEVDYGMQGGFSTQPYRTFRR